MNDGEGSGRPVERRHSAPPSGGFEAEGETTPSAAGPPPASRSEALEAELAALEAMMERNADAAGEESAGEAPLTDGLAPRKAAKHEPSHPATSPDTRDAP